MSLCCSQLLCSEEDIKEMGIPMGPRKKLMTYMRSQRQIMVTWNFVRMEDEMQFEELCDMTTSNISPRRSRFIKYCVEKIKTKHNTRKWEISGDRLEESC